MILDVYNTHMELYPYKKDDYPVIEDMFTAVDKRTDKPYPCGYMIEDGKLFLPRGASISKIEYITGCKVNYIKDPDDYDDMKKKAFPIYDPRDKLQEDSIEFLCEDGAQLSLNLKTGFGKAEPVSTLIPTPSGWKRFGDLKPGDRVYTINGTTTVTAVFPQGIKDIYRISFNDGRYLDCAYEHLSLVTCTTPDHDLGRCNGVVDTKKIIEMLNNGQRVWIPAYKEWTAYPNEFNIIDLDSVVWVEVKEVTLNRQEEAMCIKVAHRTHLYVTSQMIVTHNTFCVAYASAKLCEKTIVITPNEGIKQQWIKTYKSMMGMRSDQLMNIAGSAIIEGLMQGEIDPADVYFVNHQTLRSYLTSNSGYMLRKFFQKIKVGIKVYDESHMEFGNILLVDFFSNTKRTWYLTATFDRTDKSESKCFKQAFSSVSNFGYEESREIAPKHVIYHVVNVNSHPDQKNRAKLMGFPGFTSNKYGQYAIFDDPNQTVYNAILQILEKCKNMEGKILIFLPLIDAVDDVVKRLKKDIKNKSVAAYHSKIGKAEKEDAEKKDIIVSTIKSCGTGRDIKGLRCVISAEPVASKVVTEQTIGRLRPYAPGKDTYFFDIIDRGVQPVNWWFNARFRKIETLVKQVEYFNL